MSLATDNLKGQHIDYDTVHTIEGALGDVAQGLDGLSTTLDAQGVRKVGDGLKDTADLLDRRSLPPPTAPPTSSTSPPTRCASTPSNFASSWTTRRSTSRPPARSMTAWAGSARASIGSTPAWNRRALTRCATASRAWKKPFQRRRPGGARTGYSYPSVRMAGLKPNVEQKPFWPEGKKIADGIRRAAFGHVVGDRATRRAGTGVPKLRPFSYREP